MIEIRRILVPTDFSEHSRHALEYACSLAERFEAELILLHVLSEIVPAGPEPLLMPVMPPEFYEESEARARESLAGSLRPEWGRPAGVKSAVCWGSPVESIVEYAAEHAANLIVIATHGRTGLSHVLLGSVAERIVREACCPVLTIRDRREKPARASIPN
ncbi:Putative universal stress protein [Aquisphaera giovannonii]|uniref:Universal stress protein n=1 Tax=Aquisphaera giovannonii TaxID=406548 RepID=A0A5B9W0G1_9BACT|nr:universal stress protein [Aquisphaera giovannonii]QEH33781.1 Putative universal stress protein [Aquisphaera giovannonii]